MVERLKTAMNPEVRKPLTDVYGPLCRAGLLVMDEVKGTGTQFEVDVLEDIIVKRFARAAPTVITSNFRKDRLRNLLGDRIWSRLTGAGVAVVELGGPDRRKPSTARETTAQAAQQPQGGTK